MAELDEHDNLFIDTLAERLKNAWSTPSTPIPENQDADGPVSPTPTDPPTDPNPPNLEAIQGGELDTPASSPTVEVVTPPEPIPPTEPKPRKGLPWGKKRE